MISVSVAYGDASASIDWDGDAYSGEVVEDLCKRAAGVVLAMVSVQAEDSSA